MGTKKCTKCGEVRPLGEFSKDKRNRDGRRSRCKPCQREYKREWDEANADRKREYNREYRQANADRRREYNREYRQANADKRREYSREWAKANPEKARANKARRRARKQAATVTPFTPADAAAIWGEQPTCVYCEQRPAEHDDHFMPLARGGEHSLTNATWPACAPCNLSKRDRHPFEFIANELMTEGERAAFLDALRQLTEDSELRGENGEGCG